MTAAQPLRGRNGQPPVTVCKHGHAYTEENTYWRADGTRACQACRRARRQKERRSVMRRPAAAPSLVVVNTDGLLDIYAAMVKQALEDYRRNDVPKHYASAKAFLISAGIANPETGAIDYHGHQRYIRKRTV